MKVLVNHLGYDSKSPKRAVVQCETEFEMESFQIHDDKNQTVFSGTISVVGKVDQWHKGYFAELDFSDFEGVGLYRVVLCTSNIRSELFEIGAFPAKKQLIQPILDYFKKERCQDKYEEYDHSVSFANHPDMPRVDVSGGWYDASGDVSKYLSHLSYANYMNPQQIPMVAWALMQAGEDNDLSRDQKGQALEEATYGVDFLHRMLSEDGYFYMTVFDKWSKQLDQREICAYETQAGIKTDQWQAGFRQGGGMAIASLARASRLNLAGEFNSEQYLAAAVKAFEHLIAHNVKYLDDGKENIIDDYCALMASVELYKTTNDDFYKTYIELRANNLLDRQSSDGSFSGWWRSDDKGHRPYSHAAEEGLPIIALLQAAQALDHNELATKIEERLKETMDFHLNITTAVVNPFGYPRHYCKPVNGEKTDQFFFTHDNESGYWWQGENARLGSLACATALYMKQVDGHLSLKHFAHNNLNWVMGLNPYDACMVEGFGRNNPLYRADYPGTVGGICNGITSSLYNENDIGLCEEEDDMQSWRWGEQWIPHAAWVLLGLISL